MWSPIVVFADELLTLHVGARFWLLRATFLEIWVLTDKFCAPASLTMSQLAPQGFSCRAVVEGRALVDA
jgi:hypothetical protein